MLPVYQRRTQTTTMRPLPTDDGGRLSGETYVNCPNDDGYGDSPGPRERLLHRTGGKTSATTSSAASP
ncbi:uncharacterized protein PG986_012750 [Apiospora aurea]|uniref:Uncharacterized protein n=1 Tax=Apiospora aurea TaxID=335848 RepID=A0ABR1Q0V9_9PEZI